MRPLLVGPVLVALVLLAGTPTAAAFSLTAVIETQTRGPLDCGNLLRGQEGTQPLLGVSDETLAPDDAGGAVAPQVRPLVVVKELDRCSPPLFTALVTRERIPRVEIRVFDRQGVHFFTIRLENAWVTRISRVVRSRGVHEEVAFAYRTIHLVDERSGISASHDVGG
jgi:type VI secretion system Hcp family effector